MAAINYILTGNGISEELSELIAETYCNLDSTP